MEINQTQCTCPMNEEDIHEYKQMGYLSNEDDLCLLMSLIQIGMSKNDICTFMNETNLNVKKRMLRKYRCQILDIVHEKYKLIDLIDCLLCHCERKDENE